jgi:hypothetical protein
VIICVGATPELCYEQTCSAFLEKQFGRYRDRVRPHRGGHFDRDHRGRQWPWHPAQQHLHERLDPASLRTDTHVASGAEREICRLIDGAQKREDMIMNKETMKRAVVIAIAGAVALGAVSTASAAPVLSSTTAVNNAAPSSVIDVRYYRAGAATYGNGYYGKRGHGGMSLPPVLLRHRCGLSKRGWYHCPPPRSGTLHGMGRSPS